LSLRVWCFGFGFQGLGPKTSFFSQEVFSAQNRVSLAKNGVSSAQNRVSSAQNQERVLCGGFTRWRGTRPRCLVCSSATTACRPSATRCNDLRGMRGWRGVHFAGAVLRSLNRDNTRYFFFVSLKWSVARTLLLQGIRRGLRPAAGRT